MPFKSKKQRKWMHANKPKMARKWARYNKGGQVDDVPAMLTEDEIVINVSKNNAARKHEKGLLALNNNPDGYLIVDARNRKEIKNA